MTVCIRLKGKIFIIQLLYKSLVPRNNKVSKNVINNNKKIVGKNTKYKMVVTDRISVHWFEIQKLHKL